MCVCIHSVNMAVNTHHTHPRNAPYRTACRAAAVTSTFQNIYECFIWRKIDACHNVRRRAASGEHDAASRTSMMRIRVPHVNHRGCHSKFTSLSRNAQRAPCTTAPCDVHITHAYIVCACTRVCRERPCVCACARTSKFSSRVSHGCVFASAVENRLQIRNQSATVRARMATEFINDDSAWAPRVCECVCVFDVLCDFRVIILG